MWRPIPIMILFCGLAGAMKAVKDTLMFHFSGSIFATLSAKYWNPAVSWVNKYKNWPEDASEAFFLSKSWLVWLTDAWHLADTLETLFFFVALVLALLHKLEPKRALVQALYAAVLHQAIFVLLYGWVFEL